MADTTTSNSVKNAAKKKLKKDAAAVETVAVLPPDAVAASNADADERVNGENAHESAWMKDIAKQIRNLNKKINGMTKVDSIVAENPGVSLDDLVASRKMNADQKLQAERKPHLLAERQQLHKQQEQLQKLEEEHNKKMALALDEVRQQHQQELESVRAATKAQDTASPNVDLRKSLLLLSQFLRAAAARRSEGNDDSDESRAFEGVLLLLYGGDADAVDAAEKLVTDSNEEVPSTEGQILSVTYGRLRELSHEYSPYAAEEAWAQGVAQADESVAVTDPTIANAGLTEIQDQASAPLVPPPDTSVQNPGAAMMDTGAANMAASESWGKAPSADNLEESWISVPRPPQETEVLPAVPAPTASQNWADDAPEAAMESMTIANDGFREVRHNRGRGSYGGEHRGRGRGGFRGDRGRGGPRGGRGDGGFAGGRGGRGGGRGGRGGRGDSTA